MADESPDEEAKRARLNSKGSYYKSTSPLMASRGGRRSQSLQYQDSGSSRFESLDLDSLRVAGDEGESVASSSAASSSSVATASVPPSPVRGEGSRRMGSTRRMLSTLWGAAKEGGSALPSRASRAGRRKSDRHDVHGIVDNEMARVLSSEDGVASATLDSAFTPLKEELSDYADEHAWEVQAAVNALLNMRRSSKLEEPHAVFLRVVQHIFHKEEVEEFLPKATFLNVRGKWMRVLAEDMTAHPAFNGGFLALTLYALFGPDFADSVCDPDIKEAFIAFNTFAFFAFAWELIALCVAKAGYYWTLPFFLDLVSLLSMWSLTWFMRSSAVSDGQFSFGTIARSSRMLRLARLARVARLTRMLPGFFHAFRKSQLILSFHIVERRLWRCFLVLDHDQDKLLSTFDLRMFYAVLMQECGHMLKAGTDKLSMIQLDIDTLAEIQDGTLLSFHVFREAFLATRFGKAIRAFHLEEVEEDQSVWKLTSLISDSMSRKVCLGALVLVAMLQIIEVPSPDRSLLMGLGQLELMATASHAGQLPDASSVICNQVELMLTRQRARLGDVLYIMLDNYTYWYDEECQTAPLSADTVDPAQHSEWLIEEYALEAPSGVFWLGGDDIEHASSLVVLDRSSAVCAEAASSMYYTLCVLLLLLMFIILLNAGLATFSKKLLQPLRSLVDDMTALSCLELVHVDEEIEGTLDGQFRPGVGVPDELQDLEMSFKSMHNAIQSWSKYAPPNVVRSLFNSGVEARIGVLRCTASILFCDVAGFEDLCKGLSPPEVLTLMTSVLGRVAEAIQSRGGTLLEFIGDEVLAVFNTPNQLAQHVLAAAQAALEIHRAIAAMPQLVATNGSVLEVKCRCGVHSASILAGNIGSHQRMKYGLLGDGVNLTARLKGLNSRYRPPSRTLASEAVAAEPVCRSMLLCRPVDLVAVKGKKEPTTLYEVDWDDAEHKKQASRLHEDAFKRYLMRDFGQAKELFDNVRDLMETSGIRDEPARLLSARCAKYMKEPPPDGWDGVDRLTKKTFDPPPADDVADPPDASAQAGSVSAAEPSHSGGSPSAASPDVSPLPFLGESNDFLAAPAPTECGGGGAAVPDALSHANATSTSRVCLSTSLAEAPLELRSAGSVLDKLPDCMSPTSPVGRPRTLPPIITADGGQGASYPLFGRHVSSDGVGRRDVALPGSTVLSLFP